MTRTTLIGILVVVVAGTNATAQTLAFPSAEGFGRFAKGGRGGRVIEVTNTDASGPGSLRAALESDGPRVCVFRVGGTIHLRKRITVTHPYLTIAGQTAPGDGIMVRGAQIEIRTHDVVIRHLRHRSGVDHDESPKSNKAISANFENAHNIMLDHCSFSWGQDDTVALGGPGAKDITIQWSIISEGLAGSDGQSKGLTFWDFNNRDDESATRFSALHNFLPGSGARNPNLVAPGKIQFVNNVVYNSHGVYVVPKYGPVEVELTDNFLKHGPRSNAALGLIRIYGKGHSTITQRDQDQSKLLLRGNVSTNIDKNGLHPRTPFWTKPYAGKGVLPIRSTDELDEFPEIRTRQSATTACASVLNFAGALVPKRDAIDERLVQEFHAGEGISETISDPNEVGGFLEYRSAAPYVDEDRDGMDDDWERRHALNANAPSDRNTVVPNGFTNLENFLNELAGDSND